jgi:hypothetical protein
LFAVAVAAWPWKRAICANHRRSVDKRDPYSVSSGSFLPLFFGKNQDEGKVSCQPNFEIDIKWTTLI